MFKQKLPCNKFQSFQIFCVDKATGNDINYKTYDIPLEPEKITVYVPRSCFADKDLNYGPL
jgi:hypothetical protein